MPLEVLVLDPLLTFFGPRSHLLIFFEHRCAMLVSWGLSLGPLCIFFAPWLLILWHLCVLFWSSVGRLLASVGHLDAVGGLL